MILSRGQGYKIWDGTAGASLAQRMEIQLRRLRRNSGAVSSPLGRESAYRESEAAAQLPFYELTDDSSDLQSYCSRKSAMIKKTFYGAGGMAQQGKALVA